MEHSGFPSDETLAAFIDNRLDTPTRRRVIEHMTACDECYAVFLAATEMKQSAGPADAPGPHNRRGKTLVMVGALATAAVVVVLLAVPHWLPRPGVGMLVAAARDLPYRTIEPRLSGGFAHRPLKQFVRAQRKDPHRDEEQWQLLAAVAQVEKVNEKNATPETEHAVGLAHLLMNNWEEAVTRLEHAAAQRPKNAEMQNDLAAAYLARAKYMDRASDYAAAYETAQRAWSLAHTPEIAWTRALALENLHLEIDARAAWRDYLALDPRGPWRAEAEKHVKDLSAPSDARVWEREAPQLEAAVKRGDRATIAAFVTEFPQQSAAFAVEELIPRWASNGDPRVFDAAEAIGAEIARLTGDGYVSAVARAARSAGRQELAVVIGELEEGATALRDVHLVVAEPAFLAARDVAMRSGSPLAHAATLQIAVCWFRRNDYPATERWLDRAQREMAAADWRSYRPIALTARLEWLRGMCQFETGHPHDALLSYKRGLGAAQAAHNHDAEAALEALLAQCYERLGDVERAWQHRVAGLRVASRVGSPARLQYVLMESTIAAVTQRRANLGDILTQRMLFVAKAMQGGFLDDVHIWRARLIRNGGADALAELARARIEVAAMVDPDARRRHMTNVDLAAGELLAEQSPNDAIQYLTNSLQYVDSHGNHLLRAEVFAARSRAYVASGRSALASADRERGIAEVEAQRERIPDEQTRAAFVAVARKLYSDEIDFAISSGDMARGFDLEEHSRATTNGIAARVRLASVQRALPEDAALVEYAALPHRTVAWIVRRSGITAVLLPDAAARVPETAERMVAARNDPQRFDRASSELHAALIKPLWSTVRSARAIVFVPDPAWPRFPFAALRDAATGRYLLEDVETPMAPSASVVASGRATDAAASRQRVLVCADPDAPDGPRLVAARREADAISRAFPNAEVITGTAATRAGFVSAAPSATLIHFAGHAVNEPLNADYSALLFSGDGDSDSGTLYAWEIRKLDLRRTRLVVLAACATGTPTAGRSGMASISDAFLAAGARSTVATLWDIGDASGHELMTRMYERLHDGDSPSHALRVAQLAALHAPGAVPADWAGYELVGF
jgi:CHAT domain-containing protein